MGDIADLWSRLEVSGNEKRLALGILQLMETSVETSRGKLLAGIDPSGNRHLLVPIEEPDLPRADEKSRGIAVCERYLIDSEGQKQFFVDIACQIPALENIFASVAEDMLDAIQETSDDPFIECARVLERWRHLLSSSHTQILGKHQLMGLIAELRLVQLFAEHDPTVVDAWKGPEGNAHDFSLDNFEVEVKATRRRDGWVLGISSLEQLAVHPPRSLFVAAARFESDDQGEFSVPDLIDEILETSVVSSQLFNGLADIGYLAVDAEAYREIRFNLLEERVFVVREDFPRLTRSSLSNELPERVQSVRYEVDLSDLKEFTLASSFKDFVAHMVAEGEL